MEDKPKNVIQETDADAIRLAKTLLHEARFGALATIEPGTGDPLASRVAVATDLDGTPLILISKLSSHTPALEADARCALLLGEPAKGDPLAHPRISLNCKARRLEREGDEGIRARRRYLNRQPKAKLYADFGDFAFFRLEIERASLNGGFGRAYLLTAADLRIADPANEGLAASEQGAVEHMNADHRDAIALYARHFARAGEGAWTISGLDAEGVDLVDGDRIRRVFYPRRLESAADLRKVLVEMAKEARAALEPAG